MATPQDKALLNNWEKSFQSIGVTKDWRPVPWGKPGLRELKGFQSIGVTKDWRPLQAGDRELMLREQVSNQ